MLKVGQKKSSSSKEKAGDVKHCIASRSIRFCNVLFFFSNVDFLCKRSLFDL
jgi:hypothetical protein